MERPTSDEVDEALRQHERGDDLIYPWTDETKYVVDILAAEVRALRREVEQKVGAYLDVEKLNTEIRIMKADLIAARGLLAHVDQCGGDDSELRRRIKRWLTDRGPWT